VIREQFFELRQLSHSSDEAGQLERQVVRRTTVFGHSSQLDYLVEVARSILPRRLWPIPHLVLPQRASLPVREL
jgi:hypothetical protein